MEASFQRAMLDQVRPAALLSLYCWSAAVLGTRFPLSALSPSARISPKRMRGA